MLKKRMSMKFPKIGMRSIKTFIAVFLSMIISSLLGFTSPLYTTLTAFFCMQSSIIESSEMASKRGIGTIIGAVFSLIYLLLVPENVYMIPFGILGIIYLCILIDKRDNIPMAGAVFLIISFGVSEEKSFDTIVYVIDRVLATFVGIVIAIFVNYYIKPPNPFEKLKELDRWLIVFIEKNIGEAEQFEKIKGLEEYRLKNHEFRDIIEFYHKEINSKRHAVDIKYYMRHLTLFRTAYSHIFILNSKKEDMGLDIQKYHMENLRAIKEELIKESMVD
ncbi:FUSC family protein [Anaerosolibacter sp.]|uniref:FUSC family protein n=1 Tax=Anaerosolibacter sp. TaxID=1872527 RepID=UPI0039EFBE16